MKMRVEQNGTDEKRWEDKNNDASGQNFSKEQQIPSETTFNPADRSSFYNHAGSEGSQSSQMHACLTSPSKHAIEHVDPFSPTCVRQPLALPPRPDSVSKVQSISHQSIPPVPPNMPVSSPDNSCPPANRYANMSKSSRPICGTATGSWLPNSIMQPLAALNSRTSMDAEIRASLGLAMLHFSRRTTMHGVAHIAQARNNRGRLFWLAIMLAASVGFLINLISIVDKYWSVPILTNTLHESEGFQFPDITICNLNPIYLPPEDTPEYREMLESLRAFQRLQKRKSVLRNRMSRDKQQYTEPARRVRRQASGSTNKTAFQHAEEWQVSENTSSPRSDHTLLEESTTDLEELFRRLQALSRSSGKDLLRHRRSGALETNDNPSEPTKVTQMSGNSSDTHDWNVKGDRMRFVDKETNEAEREKSEELGLIMDKMTGFVHTNFVDWMYTQGKKFSHPAWSFIRHCKFHRDDCNYSHFYEQNIWPYGNCFTFNPELAKYTRIINKNITLNGFLPNFEVIFYKAVDVPLEFRIDVHNTLIMPTGVMVMIHEIGTFPHITQTYLLDECALLDLRITRKFHMPMKRSMTRIHDDNDDPSAIMPCQPTRRNYTYINVITRQTRVYAGVWVDCVFEHVQNLVAEFCACLMEQFPVHERFANLPFCKDPNQNISSLHLHNCLHEVYVRIFGEEFASITECYRDFCEHASFSTVISHSRFPAVEARKSHLNWLQTLAGMEVDERAHFAGKSDLARYALRLPASNNFSDASASREEWSLVRAYREGRIDLLNIEFVERNFMLLRVVPASLFMDRVEETEEYPTSRLLSDVGGCVGLWLGASLVTVFELLDLIFDFFELSQWSLARRRFTDSERRRLMAEIEVWRDRALRMEEQQQLNHPSSHIPSNSYEKQVNDNNMVYDGLRKDASFHSFTGLYTDGGMTLMPGVSAALENCLGTAVPADVHTNWLAPWLQANEKPRMSQAIIKDDTLATSLGQVQHQSGSVHQLGMESL